MEDIRILEELMKAAGVTETRKENHKEDVKNMDMGKVFQEIFGDLLEEEVKNIKEGKTTFEKAVADFKERNRFVCKIFPVPISSEDEEELNQIYESELGKALDLEEKPKKKDIDYYINELSTICKGFMYYDHKEPEGIIGYAAGYVKMMENIGLFNNEKERDDFISAMYDKVFKQQ